MQGVTGHLLIESLGDFFQGKQTAGAGLVRENSIALARTSIPTLRAEKYFILCRVDEPDS